MAKRVKEAASTNGEVDMVNHPPHYQGDGGIECIDAIAASLGRDGFIAFLRGQVIKYAWRMEHKGARSQDAGKLAWYAAKLKEACSA